MRVPNLVIRTTAALASVALTLSLVSCATSDGKSKALLSDRPTTLTLATGFTIDNVDPIDNGFWGNEFGWSELLMRPVHAEEPEPWLLKSLENTDELTWRLTLRDGVTFQNGDALDANALAAVMRYQLKENPALEPLAETKVEVTSDLEVTLTTADPAPNMPFTLADESKFVIYDQDDYLAAKGDPTALIEAQLYTGPYVVESLDSQTLTMPADPDHWGGTPPLDKVTVKFIPEEDSRILAVQKGEADLALYPPTKSAKNLKNRTDSYWVSGTPKGPTFQLNLNQNQEPFDKTDIRKAVLRVIDHRELAVDVMGGLYEVSTGMYSPKASYALDIQETDLAEAERLLTEAGFTRDSKSRWVRGGKPLDLTVLTDPAQPDSDALALAIQSQLRDFGIGLEIRQVPDITETMGDARTDWDLAIAGNGTTSFPGDPISSLQNYFASDGPRNLSGINDPDLDKLVADVAVDMDADERSRILGEIQQLIGDRGYMGFLGMRLPSVVAGPAWKDYQVPTANLWVDSATGSQS